MMNGVVVDCVLVGEVVGEVFIKVVAVAVAVVAVVAVVVVSLRSLVPQGGLTRKGKMHWSRKSSNTVPGSHSKWYVW